MQDHFKLIVSEQVQHQIKYLCSKFQSVEWSGILFYKRIKGDLDDIKKLVFEVVYIHLMDIGTSGFTEFTSDPSFMKLLDEKEELETCMQGLIHSHNNMSVFFSATDIDELIEGTMFYNAYLSLIVNNRFDLTCKLAYNRQVETVNKTTYSLDKLDFTQIPYVIEDKKKETVVIIIDGDIDVDKIKYDISDSFIKRSELLLKKVNKRPKTNNQVIPFNNNRVDLPEDDFNVEELSDFKASIDQLNSFLKYMVIKYMDEKLFTDTVEITNSLESKLLHQLIINYTSLDDTKPKKYAIFEDFIYHFSTCAEETFEITTDVDLYELSSLCLSYLHSVKKVYMNKPAAFIKVFIDKMQDTVSFYYESCKSVEKYGMSDTNYIL